MPWPSLTDGTYLFSLMSKDDVGKRVLPRDRVLAAEKYPELNCFFVISYKSRKSFLANVLLKIHALIKMIINIKIHIIALV